MLRFDHGGVTESIWTGIPSNSSNNVDSVRCNEEPYGATLGSNPSPSSGSGSCPGFGGVGSSSSSESSSESGSSDGGKQERSRDAMSVHPIRLGSVACQIAKNVDTFQLRPTPNQPLLRYTRPFQYSTINIQ